MIRLLSITFFYLTLAGFLGAQMACTANQNSEPTAEVTADLGFETVVSVTPEEPKPENPNTPSESEVLQTYAEAIGIPLENLKKTHALFVYGEPLDLTRLKIEDTDQMLRLINFILLTDLTFPLKTRPVASRVIR